MRLAPLGLLPLSLIAQTPDSDRDLQDLLKVNAAVYQPFTSASQKALTVRETPGIVSLITREEIQASGARDLMDILKTVPGFDFGVDNEGTVGLALRGNWAHEGKALLLVDGLEMNEPLFGTNQFGRHIPVEEIDHIEIIRGPGSAIYGGYAELGVIHVVTRSGRQLGGAAGSATLGRLPGSPGTRQLSLAWGSGGEGWQASASAFLGQGPRSDRTYTDVNGATYGMADQSDLRNAHLTVGAQWGNLSYRGLLERYTIDERDHYVEILAAKVPIRYNTDAHQFQWVQPLGGATRLTATAAFKRQEAWALPNDPVLPATYDRLAERSKLGLQISHDLTPRVNFLAGAELVRDHGSADQTGTMPDQPIQRLRTWGLFAQAILMSDLGNLTVGGRYDRNSESGASFAPRLAFTKAWTLSHFKLLAARAFRTPSLENLNLNADIKPETATTYEVEWGTTLAPGVYLSLNGFHTEIKDPIIFANNGFTDAYFNFDKVGTRGLEASLQWRDTWGSLSLSAATYRPTSHLPVYEVPGHGDQNLGLANRRLLSQAILRLSPRLTLCPTLRLGSASWSYAYDPALGSSRALRHAGTLEAHLFLRAEFGQGWSGGIGVYNLTNGTTWIAQPYDGGHAPLPGAGREVALRLAYRM